MHPFKIIGCLLVNTLYHTLHTVDNFLTLVYYCKINRKKLENLSCMFKNTAYIVILEAQMFFTNMKEVRP